MARDGAPTAAPGSAAGSPEAARALLVLVAPLRFALKEGTAGVERLAGLGATIRGAVDRARASGAPETPALRALAEEGRRFEALPVEERRRAIGRLAAHLAALVPVPPEIARAARASRLRPSPAPPAAATAPAPPAPPREPGSTPAPPPGPPRRPAEAGAGRAAPGATAGPRPDPRGPLERLPWAHPAPRRILEERGRPTAELALEFWPRAYQDRTVVRAVRELAPGQEAIVLVTVASSSARRTRNGRTLLEVIAGDATGRLVLSFFNAPAWRARQFAPGAALLAWGRVSERPGGLRQMTAPEVEPFQPGDSASFGRIVPVYPGPAAGQQPALRKLMRRLCEEIAPLAGDDLPAPVVARQGLLPRDEAVRQAHFPPPGTDLAAAARATPAFRRLAFEELFFLQLALARRRRGVAREPGIAFAADPGAVAGALARLPFAPTPAQRRVLDEIAADMARPSPMNRLLQGDVGSGKTAVAFAAMLLAVESGWQAVLMAPTEILAAQHAGTFARWLAGSGIEVAQVGAAARGKAARAARAAVESGRARIVVGTHALLEEGVTFDRLGLVVVDEQHRFGVLQRAALVGKGSAPDVLVMTATPIPRTLALAFYGDLDHSTIDELPPGRQPVETLLFGESQRRRAHQLLGEELAAGRQGYVVYPLVTESEKSDLADATSGAEALARTFAPHRVGLLHGRLGAEEKRAVMEAFRRGEIRLLVSTTVIEVGVDVPDASVLVVEHAERFGLSQLHQLRGRVGRGAARSRCLLLARLRQGGQGARERLEALCRTADGFELARVDLSLRGPGELLGTRQSGEALLEIADLARDGDLLDAARAEALALVEADPDLLRPEHAAAARALAGRWAARLALARLG